MTKTEFTKLPKSIMIVDDEPDIGLVFKRSLELAGYNVIAFTNPHLALEDFKSNLDKYGLIISDYRMPEMNGMELIAKIRELDADISIILASAFVTNFNNDPALKITKVLEKPFTLNQLKLEVSKYVQLEAT